MNVSVGLISQEMIWPTVLLTLTLKNHQTQGPAMLLIIPLKDHQTQRPPTQVYTSWLNVIIFCKDLQFGDLYTHMEYLKVILSLRNAPAKNYLHVGYTLIGLGRSRSFSWKVIYTIACKFIQCIGSVLDYLLWLWIQKCFIIMIAGVRALSQLALLGIILTAVLVTVICMI